MESNSTHQEAFEQKLIWSKPQVQKLTIEIDTQAKALNLQSSNEFADEG